MPKDATKNVDRYKIKGGQLNEFDFNRNQEELAEASKPNPDNFIPGTPPEKREEPLAFFGKLTKKAAKGVKGTKPIAVKANAAKATKSTKAAKSAKTKSTKAKSAKAAKSVKAGKATKAAKASKARKNAPRGATAKKLAARKAAKK
jgi:hypothetical protein